MIAAAGRLFVVTYEGDIHCPGAGQPAGGAIPIQEAVETGYASDTQGLMHACGHDAHVACALGAAMLLSRRAWPGRVRILIQPCEEGRDEEGLGGARRMIEDGAFQDVVGVVS